MIKNAKIFYLLQMVILFACTKENAELIHSNNSGLLYQLEFDNELYVEYTYNASNQIFEEKSKMQYTVHNYRNGKLVSSDYYTDPGMYSSSGTILNAAMNRKEWVNSSNTEKNSTKKYTYDDEGRIVKSENNLGICEYRYDAKNRISRETFMRDTEKAGFIDFFYDDNDNMVRRLHYWVLANGESELQTTTEYEFDKKHNPYKAFNVLIIPGVYTNANNIIKEIYTIHFDVDQYIEKVQITENRYKYNADGFPVSKNESVTYVYY